MARRKKKRSIMATCNKYFPATCEVRYIKTYRTKKSPAAKETP